MEERFYVLGTHGGNSIPWIVITPHESQARENHGQTLEQLNKRGGLSWCEMLAVLEDRPFKLLPALFAREKVEAIVDKNICTVQMVKDDDGHYVPKECCTMTNPLTSGGVSQIDDIDLPCGYNCERNCKTCVIQKIMDEYAEITKQIT